jgi:GT2 family glycosyltransferase
MGAEVVELDLSMPFTAARARNAGLEHLIALLPKTEFVQFLDGDCELAEGWIEAGLARLSGQSDLAVVCGRRRERHPEASLWNQMIDIEWDSPVGETKACGGDALMRRAALDAVGGYREDLIAGEEPEMCFRMRKAGWKIQRIDAEMTLHDAAMTKFSQWWQRARRAGHTYAEGAALHGASPDRYRVAEMRRTLFWGIIIPAMVILGTIFISPWAALIILAWPLQILRLRFNGNAWEQAIFLTLAKLPEAQGMIGYWLGRLTGHQRGLIEYK